MKTEGSYSIVVETDVVTLSEEGSEVGRRTGGLGKR